MGLPGLAGAEHIGITVPDLEAATRFFVDVIGCKAVFEVGPFASDDDWMQKHLGVDPRARINKLRMLKCANGPSIELFEYDVKDQKKAVSPSSDVGGHHIAFYVSDLDAAATHLRRHGVKMLGEPTSMGEGPSAGLRWVYFVSPWGMTMELVSYPKGMAYAAGAKDLLWKPAEP
jgi:catechol 2,3-dioxygenase-like lactoylglutathione lyase family enzyme